MPQPIALLDALGGPPTTWESTLSGMAAMIYNAGKLYKFFTEGPLLAAPVGYPATPEEDWVGWETDAQMQLRIFGDKKYCYTLAKGIIDELILNGTTEPGSIGIFPTIPSIDGRIALWQGTDGYHLQVAALSLADLALVGHNHDLVYAAIIHNHDLLYSTLDHLHTGVYSPVAHLHTGVYSPVAHLHAGVYSTVDHLHAGVYEPAFAKNTAFNKNFGTTAGTVAAGDHTHEVIGGFDTHVISPGSTVILEARQLAQVYSMKLLMHLQAQALCRSFTVSLLNVNSTSLPYTVSEVLGDDVPHLLTVGIQGSSAVLTLKNTGSEILTCRVKKDGIFT